MTAFHDLAGVATFRPFDGPPPAEHGRPSPFTAAFGDTVRLLYIELGHLEAERVVIELDLQERHLRLDGMPRADARVDHDGVRLSFDSKWGPLRYETAEFTRVYYRGDHEGWQVNLRAVALAMEALRKVDRYGVSKRGEQYRGWRQLTASTDPADAITTPAQARAVLDSYGGVTEAIKATHPDRHGGDATEFRRVQRARELVGS